MDSDHATVPVSVAVPHALHRNTRQLAWTALTHNDAYGWCVLHGGIRVAVSSCMGAGGG